ncbi:hypothetical protein PS9374_03985 [Planomonospora sphaerica]|uniref:Uncharacterized protein n=1 Tax=Planomonospora sphaerica TaxID=161355 RepID=A0A171DG96_9ACTN|nr:hypothetical protein PS9374_03985 [Planomonospora sphaerica]
MKALIRGATRACRRRPALRAARPGTPESRTRSDRPGTARHGSGARRHGRDTARRVPVPGHGAGAVHHRISAARTREAPPPLHGPAGAPRPPSPPSRDEVRDRLDRDLGGDEVRDRPEDDECGQEQRGHGRAPAPAGEPERPRGGAADPSARHRRRLRSGSGPPARPAARGRPRSPPARRGRPRTAFTRTPRSPLTRRPRARPAAVRRPEMRPAALDQPQLRPGLPRRPPPPGPPRPRGRLHGPPIAPAWPNTGRRKIGVSNTVSIELPYDVVHHAVADFEEDSNNCLKMIFDGGTVAVCDMRNTDREARRSHERAQRERRGRQ